MNKIQLVNIIWPNTVDTMATAKAAVNQIFDAMRNALRDGDKVVVQGFGSLHVVMRKSKPGRNPRTGVPVQIPARRRVKFKMAKGLLPK